MDHSEASNVELLKSALTHLREPERLNDHPWAAAISKPSEKHRGALLVDLIIKAFRKMIPSSPPRAGKRLDTRWGAFGILAAQYFAPTLLGTRTPSSLREAWESLDRSILYFVYNKTEGLSEEENARYRFAGNEIESAPNSTLSDWHRKGVEQLVEIVVHEVSRLHKNIAPSATIRQVVKWAGIALGSLFILSASFLGWKAWQMYQQVQVIEQKVDDLEGYLNPAPKLEQIPEIATKVHDLRLDLDMLQGDAEPYLWAAPYFGWIPRRGGDISQAEILLGLAGNLVTAADEGLTAVTPAIEVTQQNNQPLDIMDLVLQLQEANPQLLNAQVALAQAQVERDRMDIERLSPRLKRIVTKRIDPLFQSLSGAFPMEDALALVRFAPKLMGGGKTGPQTYLILMQNEDELRPTGGFLTAAGSAVVKDGKLISIRIESSDLVDDLSKAYPSPPWQFKEFMNIEMLLFRDSNWFTDFPTTAEWAEYFYSYSRATSADGVIAIDMQVIVQLLETLGPIRVANIDFPITSENVLTYMRAAKESPPAGVSGTWDRKQFIGQLAQPLLDKILQARGQTWTKLVPVLIKLLDERHILLQFDDQEVTELLERRNWDGAVRIPTDSDFLMAVDTNMGYNKSNAIMDTAISYSIDLGNRTQPEGVLSIYQTNHSKVDVPCEPFATVRLAAPLNIQPGEILEPIYNIDECHWGYLRVYTPGGTQLVTSTPRAIPEEATMLGQPIPARTDDLGSEDIPNAQVFGMMVVTPTRQATQTEFHYTLPGNVIQRDDATGLWIYRLRVQKQPGTGANDFTLNVRLPAGAQIENATIPLSEKDGVWTAQLDLHHDLLIEVSFSQQ